MIFLRSAGDQRGTSLIEMLIALLILGMTVSGIVAATFGAGRTGKAGNLEARMNLVITSFGEAIKALPYESCADAATYQSEFERSEGLLTNQAQNLANSLHVVFEVVSVQGGADCPNVDSGVQTINLQIDSEGRTLARQIVKRDPQPASARFVVEIKNPIRRSIDNNPDVLWGTEADPKGFQVFSYEWWCGDPAGEDPNQPDPQVGDAGWPTRPPDFPGPNQVPITAPFDATPECRYAAPAEGGPEKWGRLFLRAVEMGTNQVATVSKAFPLPTTTAPILPPVARWEAIGLVPLNLGENYGDAGHPMVPPTEDCRQVNCAANVPVTFTDISPPPVDAGIAQWIWDFGDRSPQTFCTYSVVDPQGNSCRTMQHTYVGQGDYNVTLKLVNIYGVAGTWTKTVHIAGPIVKLPKVGLTLVTQLTDGVGISPMKIDVASVDTHADGCAVGAMCTGTKGTFKSGIKNWSWDFGAGGPAQGGSDAPNASTIYPASSVAQTYTIRLTIEDRNGTLNSASIDVTLVPNSPPIGITNRGSGLKAKGDLPFFRNAYFDFQFKNPPILPGETVKYQIRIGSTSGFCGVLGIGMAGKDFYFNAGAQGTTQRVRAQFGPSKPFAGFNGVCATDTLTFYSRTIRTTPYGTFESVWSDGQRLDPEFF